MGTETNTPSHSSMQQSMPPQVGLGLPPWITRGSVMMVMFAVVAPAAIPVLIVGLPVLAVVTILRLKRQEEKRREEQVPQLVELDTGKPREETPSEQPRVKEVVKEQPEAKEEDQPAKPRPAVGGAAILAKLRAAKKYRPPAEHPVLVLYASQTGTAAEVAKNISSGIESAGATSRVISMNELGALSNLSAEKTPFVVWVASSTGDGEAPDNATKFYNDLKNKTKHEAGALQGIQFTGLGLGDSNYTRFMHVPRVVKSRFLELGATEFHPCVEADEVDGIEEIIDAWVEKMLPVLKAAVKPMEKQGTTDVKKSEAMPLPSCSLEVSWIAEGDADAYRDVADDKSTEISAASPFFAPISDARYLTSDTSDEDRRVVHVQLDLAGSGIEYGPGDSLGVLPENDPLLVDQVLERLGIDGNKWFTVSHKNMDGSTPETRPLQHIKWPCSVRDALLHGVDLTGPPKKSLLRVLAEYCSDNAEKEKLMLVCSREGRKEYMESVLKARRAFVDVLFENTSCKPPLDALLDALPPLAPRMYSISSSPAAQNGPEKAEVAFTAVEYPTVTGTIRKGVATWWLENKALIGQMNEADRRVPLYLRKGGAFSPPGTLDAPWIMIGPGTGVSPFRGFLQQRRAMLGSATSKESAGECWLFYGCRDKTKDYLYGDELEAFEKDGTLTTLCVAESRTDPANKVYVQHLMLQHKAHLRDLIVNQEGYVFICGDGHGMAKDVHAALVDIIAGETIDAKGADAMLTMMTRQARYVKDVWS